MSVHHFPNGYGASVISTGYGSAEGLSEIMVLHEDRACYDSPLGDDVLGWLTSEQVSEILKTISELPLRTDERL